MAWPICALTLVVRVSSELGNVHRMSYSDCAISVLRELILQVTDSLLLRENCGLQILDLLNKLLQQLWLEFERYEEKAGKERMADGKRK